MTTVRISAAALFLMIFLASPLFSSSREEMFISSLYHQKRYFDSIGEAFRLRKNVSPRLLGEVDYFISFNYFLGKQFLTVISRAPESGEARERRSALLLARAFLEVKNYQAAHSVLTSVRYRGKGDPLDEDIMAARVTALLYLGKYNGAGEEVKGFRGTVGYQGKYLKFDRALAEYSSMPRRSPWFSAAASGIVPGAGQLYSGRYLAAFLSLVSVAAPLTGGVFLLREGKRELAGTLFLFSAVFYGGNIYGAWNAAEHFNRRSAAGFRRTITESLPPYDPVTHLRYPELIDGGTGK